MSLKMASHPAESGHDFGGRKKGVTVVKPIVYGNVAHYFGQKREEDGHTHRWSVFVKPYHNEDMSNFVKKVHFRLHESYPNQNRVVTRPPYEVSETGWGEFEIIIKIYFHDSSEKPVTLYHVLKLFHSTPDGTYCTDDLSIEFYEEIVFQDPNGLMHHFLTNTYPITTGAWTHDTDFEEKKVSTIGSILRGKVAIRRRINILKEKLKLAKETITSFKRELERPLPPRF